MRKLACASQERRRAAALQRGYTLLVEVTFLGAGDAFCAGGRLQASYLVRAAKTTFLLDCGATALASLKRERIAPSSIDTIFISHLHGDHFAGLPFLFLEYVYQDRRERPLRIAGPPGTQRRVADLYAAMYRDAASQPLPYEVRYLELPPDEPVELDGLRVDPFRVPHQETEISLGLRIAAGDRTLLYSGDTGWTEKLVEKSQGTDLFICECCFFETRLGLHLDYPRLAENRGRFGARRLILTHLGREVLERRREVEIELAHDGLKLTL